MRILAREMGCDIVYSDELVDKRLMHCTRVVNDNIGTIDFIDAKGLVRNLPFPPGKHFLRPNMAAITPYELSLMHSGVAADTAPCIAGFLPGAGVRESAHRRADRHEFGRVGGGGGQRAERRRGHHRRQHGLPAALLGGRRYGLCAPLQA